MEAIIKEDAQPKFRLVPFAVFFISAAIIIGIAAAGLIFWGLQGNGPLSMLARATPT
ncbi:MAG: hypothetical protein GWN61_15005, partial [candidate division Zixibacteria bacterium]|nr:hypothetical protein [candidate division Zixibacteria bacterium]NIS47234.1 hypothetical protein [candidate division Zixibacteria bacterium]NIU15377.1 hypothetical protein [candidate division Zixibacteria bacterium]NIV07442.1 hypothetical protein [candidate division Zixibacteria bacterium]NIW46632.1 hypothetical protein [Gammaproteobacteria bacterium]